MVLNSDKKFDKSKNYLKILHSIDPDYKKFLVVPLLLVFISILINVTVPLLFKGVIDKLATKSNITEILIFIALYFGFWISNIAIAPLRELLATRVSERLIKKTNQAIFQKLQYMPLKTFYSQDSGQILNSLEKIHSVISHAFGDILFFIIPSAIEVTTAITILAFLYPLKYSIILLCILLVYISTMVFLTVKISKYQNMENQVKDKYMSFLFEDLINFELTKYMGHQEEDSKEFSNLLLRKECITKKSAAFQYKMRSIELSIIGTGVIFSLLFAVYDIVYRGFTTGDFVLINSYTSEFLLPLRSLGLIFFNFQKYLVSIKDIVNLLARNDIAEEMPLSPQLYTQKNKTGGNDIIFDSVTFAYSERLTLNRVSFKILGQKTNVIMGASGSGKSTIIKLLFNLYDISEGKIKIGDIDITNFSSQMLCKKIAITPQNPMLLNKTILYNIRYANSSADINRIYALCNDVGIHDFILTLPEQYNTILGNQGNILSRGQMQLIAIVRTLIKESDIYIFDEATASLDVIAEQRVFNVIKKILAEKTIIIVSHKLSLFKECDNIIVLKNATFVEQGSHNALLKNKKEYYHIWKNSF